MVKMACRLFFNFSSSTRFFSEISTAIPKTEITAPDEMMIAIKLAKAGFYGGDVQAVLNANVDHVMTAIEHEIYLVDYERAEFELNKEEG